MSTDSIERFNELENNLGKSLKRLDEIFGFGEKSDNLYSKVNAARNIVAKHDKEKRLWKNEFFAVVNGEKTGPFNIKALRNLMVTGDVDKDTLVWTKGMKKWGKAGKNSLLRGFFKTLPPQPPAPIQTPAQQQPTVQQQPQPGLSYSYVQTPTGAVQTEALKMIKNMVYDAIKGQI